MSPSSDTLESDQPTSSRATAPPPARLRRSETSARFHARTTQLQMEILDRSQNYEAFLEYTGLMLMQERVDLHDKVNDLIDDLVEPSDRLEVYRAFSDVAYKRDKMIAEVSNTRFRANEAKDQASPPPRLSQRRSATKEADQRPTRKAR